MKASSFRWGSIVPGTVLGAAMVGLTIYRVLQASGDDAGKAYSYFGITLGALCVVGVIVVLVYRHGAKAARELLAVLELRYPGRAFPIFKAGGLEHDVSTLPAPLRGAVWNKRTMYAVVTLDADSIIIWDGSAKMPVVFAQLARTELHGIEVVRESALLFRVRALKVAVLHEGVTLRVTVAPGAPGDWMFLPATDSFTMIESALAGTIRTRPER